jgi:maltose O-acetyltransferase
MNYFRLKILKSGLIKILIDIHGFWVWIEKKAIAESNRKLLSELKHCGDMVRFVNYAKIVSPDNIEIYSNVHIGNNAYLDGRGGIIIEENTHISRNFTLLSSSHNYKGNRLPYDDTYDIKPVIIRKNVWIGTNVLIVPGVEIGEGAIIAAGTVVTKPVPPLAIVGSQPERVLKYRENAHYQKLVDESAYGGISGRLIRNI